MSVFTETIPSPPSPPSPPSSSSSCSSELKIKLEDFHDGHFPGGTSLPTQIAHYQHRHFNDYVTVFDNLLPSLWQERVYQYALEKGRPWGVYIPTTMALDTTIDAEVLWQREEEKEKALALVAVRHLFFDRAAALIGPDVNSIHGTAIWCLTSGLTKEVQYHLDYAELYRYETNIIFPPIYAGTYQASPVLDNNDMIGGDFYANIEGLEHYRRFGYKGKLSSPEDFTNDFQTSHAWIRIPYRSNRGTFCDGNLPHLASKIEYIRPDMKRVILGFNAFPNEIAECCERAPEHSDAFNRTIKIYQRLAAAGLPITTRQERQGGVEESGGGSGGDRTTCAEKVIGRGGEEKKMSVKDIMKNPALAKILVMAAKNKKKRDEEEAAANANANATVASSRSKAEEDSSQGYGVEEKTKTVLL
eukprot:scaffold1105_cov184-Ochromonas_danica.AAC.3